MPVTSTITWLVVIPTTQTEPVGPSCTFEPFAIGADVEKLSVETSDDDPHGTARSQPAVGAPRATTLIVAAVASAGTPRTPAIGTCSTCLLYTSDAADED